MAAGGGRRALGGAWLAGALALAAGCTTQLLGDASVSAVSAPDGYKLGGQTGSLVPGCGVAPLSAQGRSVPAGDVLAILYARDCPESIAQQLAVLGMAADAVRVQLVPLDDDGVFLVVADEQLAGGEYQLTVGGEPSDISVDGAAVELPEHLGTLQRAPTDDACADPLRFELALDAAALAYAPLSRFELSIDGGAPQVWVDYGALPIESTDDGSFGLFELPRCTEAGCLSTGSHELELLAQIAGEVRRPEPIEIEFQIDCPAPATNAASSSSAPEVDSDSNSAAGCALRAVAPRAYGSLLASALALLAAALRRRRRRPPHSSGG